MRATEEWNTLLLSRRMPVESTPFLLSYCERGFTPRTQRAATGKFTGIEGMQGMGTARLNPIIPAFLLSDSVPLQEIFNLLSLATFAAFA